jgi:hypothetical protein
MTQTSTIDQRTIPSDVRARTVSALGALRDSDPGQRPAVEYGCVDWYTYADDQQTEFFDDKASARA